MFFFKAHSKQNLSSFLAIFLAKDVIPFVCASSKNISYAKSSCGIF